MNTDGCSANGLPHFEGLEPRLLLSGDIGAGQENLIADGGFSDLSGATGVVDRGGWLTCHTLGAWRADAGIMEIQKGTVGGAPANVDGNVLELDSHTDAGSTLDKIEADTNSTVSQDVLIPEFGVHVLSFDYSGRARGDIAAEDTSDFNVLVDGVEVRSFAAVSSGYRRAEIRLILSDDVHTVTFQGDGMDDTYGALIDNVSLVYEGAGNSYVDGAGMLHLVGGAGNDLIFGGEGPEDLHGGAGDDLLVGGAGNDVLCGGPGADRLLAGAGDDLLELGAADGIWEGAYAINMGDPDNAGSNEIAYIVGKEQNMDIFDGGDGYDILSLGDGDQAIALDDRVTPSHAGVPVFANIELIDAGAGDDVVDLTSDRWGYGDVEVRGGDGNDILWTSGGDDIIVGGAGDDVLYGGAGDDALFGDGREITTVRTIAVTTPDRDMDIDQVLADWVAAGVVLTAERDPSDATHNPTAFSYKNVGFTIDGANTADTSLHGEYAYSGFGVHSPGNIDDGEIDTMNGNDLGAHEILLIDFVEPANRVTIELSALFDGETEISADAGPYDRGYMELAQWTAYGANGEQLTGLVEGTVNGLATFDIDAGFAISQMELRAVDNGAGNTGANSDFLLRSVTAEIETTTGRVSEPGNDRIYGAAGLDTIDGGGGTDKIEGGVDTGFASFGEKIDVTFLGSDAGYDNSLGFFLADDSGAPQTGEILWASLHDTAVDATAEIVLDGVANNVGFFLVPDGAGLNTLADGQDVSFIEDGSGNFVPAIETNVGVTDLSGRGAPVFFSGAAWRNSDSREHTADLDGDGSLMSGSIGFEDLLGGGDNDFNDAKIAVNLNVFFNGFQPGDILVGGAGQDIFSFHAGEGVDLIRDFEAGIDSVLIDGYDEDEIELLAVGEDAMILMGTGEAIRVAGVSVADLAGSVVIAT